MLSKHFSMNFSILYTGIITLIKSFTGFLRLVLFRFLCVQTHGKTRFFVFCQSEATATCPKGKGCTVCFFHVVVLLSSKEKIARKTVCKLPICGKSFPHPLCRNRPCALHIFCKNPQGQTFVFPRWEAIKLRSFQQGLYVVEVAQEI